MAHGDVDDVLVTTPDGRLMGRLARADAERLLEGRTERSRPGKRLGRERRRVGE